MNAFYPAIRRTVVCLCCAIMSINGIGIIMWGFEQDRVYTDAQNKLKSWRKATGKVKAVEEQTVHGAFGTDIRYRCTVVYSGETFRDLEGDVELRQHPRGDHLVVYYQTDHRLLPAAVESEEQLLEAARIKMTHVFSPTTLLGVLLVVAGVVLAIWLLKPKGTSAKCAKCGIVSVGSFCPRCGAKVGGNVVPAV